MYVYMYHTYTYIMGVCCLYVSLCVSILHTTDNTLWVE